MYRVLNIAAGLLALASTSLAAAIDERTYCVNSLLNRQCWSMGLNVDTPTDQTWPKTGRVRKYNFELTRQNYAPDGHMREMLLINGQYPGPLIEANWGDTISVTVKNSVPDNGTSIHWHGFRQLNTNTQDGTNGITECPLAPGQTETYTFVASQYGTSWYHSHYSMQYANGVVGNIIVHGPTTANWDVDTPPISITDWFYQDAFPLYDAAKVARGPPTADNVLINGKMVSAEGGSYFSQDLVPGLKNLLHFVNTGINDYFHIALDGHSFTVVAIDFNPVVPFVTDTLVLGIGQRVDVIVKANMPIGSYWLRVGTGNGNPNSPGCDGPVKTEGSIKAIFHYIGALRLNPTSVGPALTTGCYDMPNIVMRQPTTVPSGLPTDFQFGFTPADANGKIVQWLVNSSAIDIDWEKPTLQYVENGVTTYPKNDNVVEINVDPNAWTYWVINQEPNNPPIPHPIHLHGHDFFILSQGSGPFDGSLNLVNPVRRDTATLPQQGHLVLAFKADNPGAWLMHCHIPFHISGGLGLQFLERKADILKTVGSLAQFDNQCKTWDAYENSGAVVQDDSGL